LSKTGLKIYYFCQPSKKAKNSQMSKPFYFWQTVSKRPNGNPVKNSSLTAKIENEEKQNLGIYSIWTH